MTTETRSDRGLRLSCATAALLASGLHVAVADDVNATSNTGEIAVGFADVTFISLSLGTVVPRELIIHYAAECQSDDGYIEYDILVDGVQVSPTHDNFSALCSSPASPATVGTTVMRMVAAGNHTVRVRGHVENGVGPGRIDDQSLVVEEAGP